MKKVVLFLGIVGAAIVLPTQMMGQTNSLTLSGTASATIVSATSIVDVGASTDKTLDFGQIRASATAGTCTLTTATATRISGGGITLPNPSAVGTNAIFKLSGVAGTVYNITLPAAAVNVTRTGGNETMTVSGFVARTLSAGVNGLTGTFNATTGTDDFTVGAVLAVGASQVEGVYTGVFPVTVANP
ncbi:MAG: DUF4402 domain-containing protein [Paludibacteraceae bacterium]|nr:DUF4402 domain-containing protein [Paludibacteraceae bacterium]